MKTCENLGHESHPYTKFVGAKSVLLKICGCICTHCTHTNQAPDSKTPFSKLMGSAEPIKPMLTRPLPIETWIFVGVPDVDGLLRFRYTPADSHTKRNGDGLVVSTSHGLIQVCLFN